MAERVIELFEAVDIEDQQRDLAAGLGGCGEAALEVTGEFGAIGEACQRILLGQPDRQPALALQFASAGGDAQFEVLVQLLEIAIHIEELK